jgi:hypothetical protein
MICKIRGIERTEPKYVSSLRHPTGSYGTEMLNISTFCQESDRELQRLSTTRIKKQKGDNFKNRWNHTISTVKCRL